jgi:hypothetical protein
VFEFCQRKFGFVVCLVDLAGLLGELKVSFAPEEREQCGYIINETRQAHFNRKLFSRSLCIDKQKEK